MPRAHWLQHVEHEDLGGIGPWLKSGGFEVTRTRLHAGEALPSAAAVDWLIIMGGPMNIYQYRRHPWLREEKRFIDQAIVRGVPVLGFCLGAQLIADVLGGRVVRNEHTEIGFFDVYNTADSNRSAHLAGLPERFKALHWHGDRLEIPPGAVRLQKSDGCVNQSFNWGPRVLALQYHLEARPGDIKRWLQVETPKPQRYVQSGRKILSQRREFTANARYLRKIFENMAAG